MNNTISSRTPEGWPNLCPICQAAICIEPSQPLGDAPCPNCGTLLWFFNTSEGMRFHESKAVAPIRDRVLEIVCETLGVDKQKALESDAFIRDVGADSLDIVELVMQLEEELGISVPDEAAEHMKTVGDAIDYIARHRAHPTPATSQSPSFHPGDRILVIDGTFAGCEGVVKSLPERSPLLVVVELIVFEKPVPVELELRQVQLLPPGADSGRLASL